MQVIDLQNAECPACTTDCEPGDVTDYGKEEGTPKDTLDIDYKCECGVEFCRRYKFEELIDRSE